jgi:hypothetical protein
MRVVAYSIKSEEKESLARANQKKHDITLISNALDIETLHYALGKDAVVIGPEDQFNDTILKELANNGIKYILIRYPEMPKFKLPNTIPDVQLDCLCEYASAKNDPEKMIVQMAQEIIHKLNAWQSTHCCEKTE